MCFQALCSVARQASPALPEFLRQQYAIISAAFQLDASVVVHPDCYGSYFWSTIVAMYLILTLESVLLFTVWKPFRKVIEMWFRVAESISNYPDDESTSYKFTMNLYIFFKRLPSIIQALSFKAGFVLYSLYAPMILNTLACDSEGRLKANPFFECFSGEHLHAGILAIFSTILYLIGFLLLSWGMYSSEGLAKYRDTIWNRILGSDNVRNEKWWWRQATCLLYLVIAFIGLLDLTSSNSQLVRMIALSVSLVLYSFLLVKHRPYEAAWQNGAKVSMCLLTVMCAVLNYVGFLNTRGADNEKLLLNLSYIIFVALAIFAGSIVIAFVMELVRTARNEQNELDGKLDNIGTASIEMSRFSSNEKSQTLKSAPKASASVLANPCSCSCFKGCFRKSLKQPTPAVGIGEDDNETEETETEDTFTQHMDKTGKMMYVNRRTSTVTYKRPRGKSVYTEHLDGVSGRKYFANTTTRSVRWDIDNMKKIKQAKQFRKHYDPTTGSKFYENIRSGSTRWILPSDAEDVSESEGHISPYLKEQVYSAMERSCGGDLASLNELYSTGAISEAEFYAACMATLDNNSQSWQGYSTEGGTQEFMNASFNF